MDSSQSYLGPADRRNRMEAAQSIVRRFEGDSPVINERYDKNYYLTRRAYYLGIVDPSTKVFPRARADAELVFASQPETLSMQAVRARELSCDLEPLLPFPTQQNCDSLTTFDEYPSEEWQVGDPPTFPREHQDSPPRSFPDLPEQAPDALLQTPRLLQHQQTANSFPAPPGTVNPRLLTTIGMAPALLNPPSPDTLRQVIFDLQFPLGTRQRPPPKYRADEGVAALSGRGISVPVKTPPKLAGKKRARTEMHADGIEHLHSDDDDDDQVIDLEAAAPSDHPRGQKRRRPNPKAAATNPASKAPKGVARRLPRKPRTSVKKRAAATSGVKWLSAVSGNRLPKTMKEAQEAAVERKQVLEEAHSIKHHAARHLDFPPEFFDTHNFTEDERANIGNDNGPIRCICGEGEVADKLDWIQCDANNCGVWQHVDCMKDAVPEDEKKRETAKYLCQVCDPWKHRRLIQRLRRQNPDPVLAATKVEAADDDE